MGRPSVRSAVSSWFCAGGLELCSTGSVAIDGSKFKAVNARDRNFTQAKMQRRLAQIDESIARYLSQLDSADRKGEAVPEVEAKIKKTFDQESRGYPKSPAFHRGGDPRSSCRRELCQPFASRKSRFHARVSGTAAN